MTKSCLFQKGLAFFACLFLFAGSAIAQNWLFREAYSNNATVTIPDGVTAVKAEGWGGGGAGGYVSGGLLDYKASGAGGGGAYAADIIPVTSGNTVSISVGIAGQNSSSSSSIKNGGNTVVSYGGTTYVSAAGGKSVTGTNNTTGAQGGQASSCIGKTGWKYSGGKGGNGLNGVTAGGGGAAADACGDGGSGEDGYVGGGTALLPIEGGTPPTCSNALAGKGGDGRTGASGPTAGTTFGGGGSGVVSATLGFRKRTGGAGAKGGARLTYIIFIVNDGTLDDPICSSTGFSFAPTGTIPTNTTYTWTVVPNSNVTVAGNGTTPASNIAVSSITNKTSSNQTVTFNCTASYTDPDYGFGTLTRDFTVTVVVYGKLDGGVIAEHQFVCQNQTIQTLTSVTDATGGSGNSNYQWRQYVYVDENGNHISSPTWEDISGANSSTYTPMLNGMRYIARQYKDNVCGNVYATDGAGMNYLNVTTVNPYTFEGGWSYNDTICSNISSPYTQTFAWHSYSSPALATSSPYGQYWQKSTDKGATWTDIAPGFVSGFTTYTLTLTSSDITAGADYWYRAAVKINDCDSIPSNEIYKIHVEDIPFYTDLSEDLDVFLWYGACDTNIANLPVPTLNPSPKSIIRTDSYTTVDTGTYTISWAVTDNCDIVTNYNQKVTVKFPACGTTVKDANGNEYQTVRIGCDCWIAENLKTNADGAAYYNEDNANEGFGKLYDWNAAVGSNNTEQTGKTGTYIQGVCPDGWAIPTVAKFNNMLAEVGDVAALKSDDETTWLPGNAGTNTSGFGAKGAGYYEGMQYQRQLGYTYFWTCEFNPSNSLVARTVELRCGCGEFTVYDKSKESKVSVRCVKVELND